VDGEDLTAEVRRELGVGRLGDHRHAFTSPASDVRDQHVGSKVQLGLEEDDPASRSSGASITKTTVEFRGQASTGERMRQCGPRLKDELTMHELCDLIRGRGQHVLLGRELLGGAGHAKSVARRVARTAYRLALDFDSVSASAGCGSIKERRRP
jgi:hypothetical protein